MRSVVVTSLIAIGCASPKAPPPVATPPATETAPAASPAASSAPPSAPTLSLGIDDDTIAKANGAIAAIVRVDESKDETKVSPVLPKGKASYRLVTLVTLASALGEAKSATDYRLDEGDARLAKGHTYVVFYRPGPAGKALPTTMTLIAFEEIDPSRVEEYGAAYAKKRAK